MARKSRKVVVEVENPLQNQEELKDKVEKTETKHKTETIRKRNSKKKSKMIFYQVLFVRTQMILLLTRICPSLRPLPWPSLYT